LKLINGKIANHPLSFEIRFEIRIVIQSDIEMSSREYMEEIINI
jgi:hypothetical protein